MATTKRGITTVILPQVPIRDWDRYRKVKAPAPLKAVKVWESLQELGIGLVDSGGREIGELEKDLLEFLQAIVDHRG